MYIILENGKALLNHNQQIRKFDTRELAEDWLMSNGEDPFGDRYIREELI